jgi:secondary thiamine-phosphate synthase enzyme
MWIQREIQITSSKRGFHLINEQLLKAVPEIKGMTVGILHLFIKHTSASLTINENADPTVRADMERHFNVLVPENAPYYQHTYEGPDDMPAHIKSTIIGCNQTIPISNGQLNIGMWQGVYLCEHRDQGPDRTIVITINGQ